MDANLVVSIRGNWDLTQQDGRMTKKCRARLRIPGLGRHFFVMLPSFSRPVLLQVPNKCSVISHHWKLRQNFSELMTFNSLRHLFEAYQKVWSGIKGYYLLNLKYWCNLSKTHWYAVFPKKLELRRQQTIIVLWAVCDACNNECWDLYVWASAES